MSSIKALILFAAAASAAVLSERQILTQSQVCSDIASQIDGDVYSSPLSLNYIEDSEHYMSSSSQAPTCVVEVESPEDISTILEIVASSRTPFAVKSGGHASNQGFSSTTGVQISLVRLNQVTLSADKSTVEIGLGNIWTDVYTALDGSGVNVVGGRVPGPGTGGFSLGGGYSWLSNQFGLTCDTIQSYNLILPNGTITTVDESNTDLFFALKGGLNRFGIVSSIVYRTVPQPDQVYGGIQLYAASAIPALITATQQFQATNTDPKAQIIFTVNGGPVPEAILILFYDGPTRPAAFNPFNNIGIPLLNTLATQSFVNFVSGIPALAESGNRGAFATLSTTGLTTNFLKAVHNETIHYGTLSIVDTGTLLSYDVEPFLNYGQFATDSAYPHSASQLPLNLYFSWVLAANDNFWRAAIQQSIDTLTQVAINEGIYNAAIPAYPNYALGTYSAQQVYGTVNAQRLSAIRAVYDPARVMDLAGGFNI